jgi:Protein of unknown function (DUF3048) N-terminal domain/Protein of unknown function (DUF3048) C-terminal domain
LALSTRGKALIGVLVFVLAAGAAFVGYRLLTKEEGDPIIPGVPILDEAPVACPLTGLEPESGSVLDRRVLSVKIENTPEARPQMGLEEADIVYEQEAEGGITRFNVLYHCGDADRIGPIRSARPVDPAILAQFGEPLFVHSGSVDAVVEDIDEAGIEDINCNFQEDVCPRDQSREAPHDVFTSTDALRDAGKNGGVAPEPVFTFDEEEPDGSKKGRQIHLNFSPVADVVWRYRGNQDEYLRFHGEDAHELEDGTHVSATNVVVMLVERLDTRITDSAGNPVPNFEVVGRGDLFVFRNGRVIEGTWQRETEEDPTSLLDRQGDEIPLAPGRTWVELFPTDAPQPIEF